MIICTMYSDLRAFNSKLINSIDLITVAIAESSFWILDINILYKQFIRYDKSIIIIYLYKLLHIIYILIFIMNHISYCIYIYMKWVNILIDILFIILDNKYIR